MNHLYPAYLEVSRAVRFWSVHLPLEIDGRPTALVANVSTKPLGKQLRDVAVRHKTASSYNEPGATVRNPGRKRELNSADGGKKMRNPLLHFRNIQGSPRVGDIVIDRLAAYENHRAVL